MGTNSLPMAPVAPAKVPKMGLGCRAECFQSLTVVLRPSHSCSITPVWKVCKPSNGNPHQGFIRSGTETLAEPKGFPITEGGIAALPRIGHEDDGRRHGLQRHSECQANKKEWPRTAEKIDKDRQGDPRELRPGKSGMPRSVSEYST